MRQSGKRARYGWATLGLTGTLAAVALASASALPRVFYRRPSATATIPTATVRRADLRSSLMAAGLVQSSKRTTIKCDLENLSVGVRGNSVTSSGSSTILEIVPDGSNVKTGDVLCRLDGSEYEEMVRQQQMNVERARADFRVAELNLDVAKTAVEEYEKGTLLQTIKDYEGRMALSRSELERSKDRLSWANRLVGKGYLPRSQLLSEQLSLLRAQTNLTDSAFALDVFRKYSAAKALRELACQVLMAEAQHSYQRRRLQRHEERLATFERQVERCTIRAPHDGLVIYANNVNRGISIEPGVAVRQNQELLYLPDLARMEVDALVHESVVSQVDEGMMAKVRVEGLPDRILEAHVEEITQVPMWNRFSDVRYFVAVVKLDTVPRGLLPGMSAEVEIFTLRRPGALAIPSAAVTIENGREICYVAHDAEMEKRAVNIGLATPELLEVTAGLDEGEQVVLNPAEVVRGDATEGVSLEQTDGSAEPSASPTY